VPQSIESSMKQSMKKLITRRTSAET
jgi:hypothetical protein